MVKLVPLLIPAAVDLRNFVQILQEVMVTRPSHLGQISASIDLPAAKLHKCSYRIISKLQNYE